MYTIKYIQKKIPDIAVGDFRFIIIDFLEIESIEFIPE